MSLKNTGSQTNTQSLVGTQGFIGTQSLIHRTHAEPFMNIVSHMNNGTIQDYVHYIYTVGSSVQWTLRQATEPHSPWQDNIEERTRTRRTMLKKTHREKTGPFLKYIRTQEHLEEKS